MKTILYGMMIVSCVGCGSNTSSSRNENGAVNNEFKTQRNDSPADITCDSLTNVKKCQKESNSSNEIHEEQNNNDLKFQAGMSEVKETINESNKKIEMERVNKIKAQKKIDEQDLKIRELNNSIDNTEDNLGVISNKAKN